VVPVVIRNASDALPKNGIFVHPATIEVVVLPPIPTRGWTRATVDREVEAVRARYLEVLEA
jgi:putative phosphoserine phosphatase/1-acylglycerol-3-phosphate O-acyltransferase